MAKHRHELAFLTLAVYHHPVLRVLFALLWVGSLASCGSATVEPKVEHEARLLSPIPACAAVLPSPAPGVQVALRKEYWTIVFPAFDAAQGRLPADALACTGAALLQDGAFSESRVVDRLTDEQITMGGGADGIKAVWLRSHLISENGAAGALALVRTKGEFAYVIAVGVHRGRIDARLSLDRLGSDIVLLVREEGCKGDKKGPCQSLLSVYLVRQGKLSLGTRLALEQMAFGDGETLGEEGQVFHLTASPSFVDRELRVMERVRVLDRLGRVVRWAELERVFIEVGDVLEPSDDPLWTQMTRRIQRRNRGR